MVAKQSWGTRTYTYTTVCCCMMTQHSWTQTPLCLVYRTIASYSCICSVCVCVCVVCMYVFVWCMDIHWRIGLRVDQTESLETCHMCLRRDRSREIERSHSAGKMRKTMVERFERFDQRSISMHTKQSKTGANRAERGHIQTSIPPYTTYISCRDR